MPMNAYACYERDGINEAASLVFAKTAQRARVISFGIDWHNADDWCSWRAKRLRDLPSHLQALDNGTEQVISCPKGCDRCGIWGFELTDEGCKHCTEIRYL